ncbi:segregation and condensation protein B [Roseiarcus fermentans]|uniref:Segregation and condensation protein B n=1 Tax=Roseiarcus fermentans TaxID=1473586 RepID=A0A366EUX2_9HYPH|nr:SMC-Scp complex subunit ScpB [Roseiarcus fermentans]RBP05285.1 segregation and condensation protein B [Roseiarcus fermentans]
MARRPTREPDFDRELSDLPPELRWREWKARVEAVLFAAAKPVGRDVLARVVGRDCALELLLDDLSEDLRGRPIQLVRAGESLALHTRPAFGPAVRVAFDIPAGAKELTKLEAGVLMAIAMFQPVTRGELTETFGKEISRDLIASLRDDGLIAAGPRSPTLGAPYAYVTTEKFLLEFGFESLRDLPDLENLKDAGLLGAASRELGRARLAPESATGDALPDEASLLADLAGVLDLEAEVDEPEEDAA